MTSQEVKDYLSRYRESLTKTKEITDHLAELRAVAESLRNEHGQRVALDVAVANLVDAQEQTAAELNRLCAVRGEILGTIDSVPKVYRPVLIERYVNGKTWEQVAVDLNYSYRGITKLHGRALLAVKECIEVPT